MIINAFEASDTGEEVKVFLEMDEASITFNVWNRLPIPEKISKRFEQVFNRKMSVELYNKLIKIYSDPQILMKALQIAEEH